METLDRAEWRIPVGRLETFLVEWKHGRSTFVLRSFNALKPS